MAGLLGALVGADDTPSDYWTKKDDAGLTAGERLQPLWSGLIKSGLLAVAGGQQMMPSERARYIAEMGGSLGDIPTQMLQQRTQAQQMLLKQQEAADTHTYRQAQTQSAQEELQQKQRWRAYAQSPEFLNSLAGLTPAQRAIAIGEAMNGKFDAVGKFLDPKLQNWQETKSGFLMSPDGKQMFDPGTKTKWVLGPKGWEEQPNAAPPPGAATPPAPTTGAPTPPAPTPTPPTPPQPDPNAPPPTSPMQGGGPVPMPGPLPQFAPPPGTPTPVPPPPSPILGPGPSGAPPAGARSLPLPPRPPVVPPQVTPQPAPVTPPAPPPVVAQPQPDQPAIRPLMPPPKPPDTSLPTPQQVAAMSPDQRAEYTEAAAAGGAGPGALPGAKEEFLKTLDPARAALVKSIASYNHKPMPEGTRMASAQSRQNTQIMQQVRQYYPDYNERMFTRLNGIQNEYTAHGATGRSMLAMDTAYHHLGRLDDAMRVMENTNSPDYNKLRLSVLARTGSDVGAGFSVVKSAVADEMGKAFRQSGALTNAEQDDWQKKFNEASSPAQMRAAVVWGMKLLEGKEESIKFKYSQDTNGMKMNDFISPSSKASAAKIKSEFLQTHNEDGTLKGSKAGGAGGGGLQQGSDGVWRFQ